MRQKGGGYGDRDRDEIMTRAWSKQRVLKRKMNGGCGGSAGEGKGVNKFDIGI